jgi:flavin reductase (DIM6/NTAB) family NADH-FMN oxidoreductase RutF
MLFRIVKSAKCRHFSDLSNIWQSFDPSKIQKSSVYNLITSSIAPRPIAVVTTQSAGGIHNCALFSYFNAVSHDPPLITLGLCTKGRNRIKKDTLNNIEETKEFVVNILSQWYLEAANKTSGNYPSDVDEIKLANLTPMPCEMIAPPRLKEAAVQLECQVKLLLDYLFYLMINAAL